MKNVLCGTPKDGPWAAWQAVGSGSRSLRAELGAHCAVEGPQSKTGFDSVCLSNSEFSLETLMTISIPLKDGFITRTFDCCLSMYFYKFI